MTTAVVPVVVVHGGAGDVAPETRDAHLEGCRRAAARGLEVLLGGGSALDAVEAAVVELEDDPIYNAGTGASLTWDGLIELDAGVMEGTAMRAGAVAALPPFRNPVRIARHALDEGRHVLYAAEGAAAFARARGFEPAPLEAMRTARAVERLERFKAGRESEGWAGGTVGAVACDRHGHVAAATSTGGTVGKRAGRVGDTPLFGAGTWADDASGACSGTGIGEMIIRVGLARTACDLLRTGAPASDAARLAIDDLAARVGGTGGLILVDRNGEVGIVRNTQTMSHAVAIEGRPVTTGV